MNFIQQIVEHTLRKYSIQELKDNLYIFPSKRAVAIFNQILKDKTEGQTYILPETKTIQEFFIEYSRISIVDEFYLLQKLFIIHESITQSGQTFHQFISWGKLILKDFDEIDKYNIDTEYFFDVLQAHKDIDEHYELKNLTNEYLQIFYKHLENDKKGILYDDFVKTWQHLGATYKQLQATLITENIGYEGMAYKKLVRDIELDKTSIPYNNIIFCGFNAFTYCEEKLLDILLNKKNIETWWDVDELFMNNDWHEAGNFLRNYKQKYTGENHHWCFDRNEQQTINIVSLSSNVGQVHYAKSLINPKENNAIVLCDESLLEHCQPIFDKDIVNITMGSKVKNSNVCNIIQNYLSCIQNINENFIYIKDFATLISYHELEHIVSKESNIKSIEHYSFPIEINSLSSYIDDESFLNLFKNLDTRQIIFNCISLIKILALQTENEKIIARELTRVLEHFHKIVNYDIIQSIKDIKLIIQNYILNSAIPFETKRDNNIQIMGFLETRLQDFESLYILSLNDKNLPGTNKSNSFIPYHLRKSFQLPTFDQFDGVNAYHFYRLLKRAKNIYLIYNNSANADSDNEKSRFIRQIEYEFDSKQIAIHSSTMNMLSADVVHTNNTLHIPKSSEIIEQLEKIKYTASSINTYLTCPIQFYLKYILKVYIPDELNTSKESADFGTILHKILEKFYTQNKGARELNEYEKNDYIQQAIADLGYPKSYFKGNNAFSKKIIEKLFTDVLDIDQKEPFEILGLEQELKATLYIKNKEITIYGKIDRIDKQNNNIRILDYKTGNIKLCNFPIEGDGKSIDDFFNKILNKTATPYKETFQGLLYAWLYYRNYPNANILVGYFTVKKLQNGIQYLNNAKTIDKWILNLFEEKLVHIIEEIIDIHQDFILSENKNSYQYALAYKELLLI